MVKFVVHWMGVSLRVTIQTISLDSIANCEFGLLQLASTITQILVA